MISRMISAVLVAALLHGSLIAQELPQSSRQTTAEMQEVLRKAQRKDKAIRVILNRKIDTQQKLTGNVSNISDTGFVITDQKTGTATTLAYSDVREVRQKGLPKAAQVGIVVGVFVGIVAAIFIAIYPKT